MKKSIVLFTLLAGIGIATYASTSDGGIFGRKKKNCKAECTAGKGEEKACCKKGAMMADSTMKGKACCKKEKSCEMK